MVESESITGALNAHERAAEANASATRSMHSVSAYRRNMLHNPQAAVGASQPYFDGEKLYREYMRREGRSDSFKAHTGGFVNGYPDRASATPSRGGTSRSKGQEEKRLKAQQLAERAKIGEETFKDF